MSKSAKKSKGLIWNRFTIPRAVIILLLSLVAVFGYYFLVPPDEPAFTTATGKLFFFGFIVGFIGLVSSSSFLVVSIIKLFANAAAEVQREQEAKEEQRLSKIKMSMTPAEWETYKLQIENNKLLKDLQKSNNSKKSTTTIGFME